MMSSAEVLSKIEWGLIIIRRVRSSGFKYIARPEKPVKLVDHPIGLQSENKSFTPCCLL